MREPRSQLKLPRLVSALGTVLLAASFAISSYFCASPFYQPVSATLRDLGLEPEKNVRRIGEALVLVSEIRNEIYNRRPDLIPPHSGSPRINLQRYSQCVEKMRKEIAKCVSL